MRLIPLTRNKFAAVDDADFDWLNQWKWHALYVPSRGAWYAARRDGKRGPYIYMHRLILATPKGLDGEHKDGDGLNNQRYNLRNSTRRQNNWNQRKTNLKRSSRFKGVCAYGQLGKFKAEINTPLGRKHLGVFTDEKEAAIAYDRAARENFGEFARTNF